MTGSDTIFIDRIIPSLRANSQKQAFQLMTEEVSRATGLNQKRLMSKLLTREGPLSSGIGNGIAIPQLTLKELRCLRACRR